MDTIEVQLVFEENKILCARKIYNKLVMDYSDNSSCLWKGYLTKTMHIDQVPSLVSSDCQMVDITQVSFDDPEAVVGSDAVDARDAKNYENRNQIRYCSNSISDGPIL